MKDQAYNLRKLIRNYKDNKSNLSNKKDDKFNKEHSARVITITSGKGGVGKTNFTINLGIILSKFNNRVTIVDADLGLGNIDVVLGLVPKYTLANVLKEEMNIHDIKIKGPNGINIISGGSGIIDMLDLPKEKVKILIDNFLLLNDISDYILIDTGAGLNNSVISFIDAADEMILIVTPEPTSITDAYAVIKNIKDKNKKIKIVINRVETSKEGYEVFNKMNLATKRFLDLELENLGFIYEDSTVKKSVKEQKPFVIQYPNSLSSKGIELIALNLINNSTKIRTFNGFQKFINKLFSNF
ncbi:MinD/ParA family protein [Caminicella sporogenes]|uniref:MinD/ParA family protein n=1 Tax=Caminicella sporogenes TaxID=166485 RepID=UPI00254256A5|nr:MinD/ParA family protein [Caminicella sporogenes]WIF94656.1 MinD/ParA family protein [Caminicella sporogenes]